MQALFYYQYYISRELFLIETRINSVTGLHRLNLL